MEKIMAILKHPDEVYPLVKLKMAATGAAHRVPSHPPHWSFCYAMLHRLSSSFPLLIHHLPSHLRDPVCVFYLVLRALDTVEDDTSIPADTKVPILLAFHEHIHDSSWHFSCGTKDYKVLMDEFHHVSTAFSGLQRGYQEAIEDITRLMGAGMAKFISKEVESIEDFDEYSGYVGGLVGLGLSKIFSVPNLENSPREDLSNSMGSFLSKTNIIQDFLEDLNEVPKPRMFWPREIWSKYVNKLSDLKYEENSEKAVKCLNDMVTNALMHVEECLECLSSLQDQSTFKPCAIPQVMAIGTLTLCYNNDQFFKGVVKMRRGLAARIFDQTKTMADVYGAFYDFSCMLKAKIDENDPDATKTIRRIERIQKICRESGTLNKRKLYIVRNCRQHDQILKLILMIMVAALVLRLSTVKLGN